LKWLVIGIPSDFGNDQHAVRVAVLRERDVSVEQRAPIRMRNTQAKVVREAEVCKGSVLAVEQVEQVE
jgi:molybdenum cofactor biosynthesis enzyme